ncbi:MAG: hypothetical protein QXO30_01915 [Candidatus Caldarchaeum sp.]
MASTRVECPNCRRPTIKSKFCIYCGYTLEGPAEQAASEIDKLKLLVERAEEYFIGLVDIVIRYRDYLENTETNIKKLSNIVEALTKGSIKIVDSLSELLPAVVKDDLKALSNQLLKTEKMTEHFTETILPKIENIDRRLTEIEADLKANAGSVITGLAQLSEQLRGFAVVEKQLKKLDNHLDNLRLEADAENQTILIELKNSIDSIKNSTENLATIGTVLSELATSMPETINAASRAALNEQLRNIVDLPNVLLTLRNEFTLLRDKIENLEKTIKAAKNVKQIERLHSTATMLRRRNMVLRKELKKMSAALANKKSDILKLHHMLERRARDLEILQNKNQELRRILRNFRKKSSLTSKTKGRKNLKGSSTTKKTGHKTKRTKGRKTRVNK